MKNSSKFKNWFIDQYGRYPSISKINKLSNKINNIEYSLNKLKNALESENLLLDKQESALKAYCAFKNEENHTKTNS